MFKYGLWTVRGSTVDCWIKWLFDIFSPFVWEWWGAANVRTKWSGRLARIWNGDTLTANQSRAVRSRDLLYTNHIQGSSHSSSRQEPDVSMTDGGGDEAMASTLVIIVTAAGKFHRHYHHCIALDYLLLKLVSILQKSWSIQMALINDMPKSL